MAQEATSKTVFYTTNQDNNTVETPDELFAALDEVFHFTHDPCPTGGLENDNIPDGLTSEWGVCNYVNPPYNCTELWIKKAARELSERGCKSVFLVPVHINTRYWREYVFTHASEVWFIGDRISFKGYTRKIPTPLCVIVFSIDRTWNEYRKRLSKMLGTAIERRNQLDKLFKVLNPSYRRSDQCHFYKKALHVLNKTKSSGRKGFTTLRSGGYSFYRFSLY